jgi:hypothetical protein
MKKNPSTPGVIGIALVAAITLACMSVYIERTGPELVQYSNLCTAPDLGPCYKPALKGGFPVPYLFDSPGISRERQLAFGEDKLHIAGLIADIAVYFLLLLIVAWAIRRRPSAGAPDAV